MPSVTCWANACDIAPPATTATDSTSSKAYLWFLEFIKEQKFGNYLSLEIFEGLIV
jgi:hypothetical protein